MSELANSPKRLVEGLAEVIRSYVVVVEPERVLHDNVSSKGMPDFVDGKNLVTVFVLSDPFAKVIDPLANIGFKLSDCSFREPVMYET